MLIPMEGERMSVYDGCYMLGLNDLVFFICFRKAICRVGS